MRVKVVVALLIMIMISVPAGHWAQTSPRVVVAWDPIVDPDLELYRIKLGTSVTNLTIVKNVDKSVTEGTVDTIESGVTYQIVVLGVDKQGLEGEQSNPISFNFGWVQPASPTNLKCTVANGTQGKKNVTCTWSPVSLSRSGSKPLTGVTYLLERHTTQTVGNPVVVYRGVNLSFSDVGLKKNTTFYYVVTAVSNTNVESNGSPAIRIQT